MKVNLFTKPQEHILFHGEDKIAGECKPKSILESPSHLLQIVIRQSHALKAKLVETAN